MVQSKMGMTPIYYETIDEQPTPPRKIKKTVAVNGGWEERIFIRVPIKDADHRSRGNSDLENWCYEHYKEPKYLGPWFKLAGYIILDEKTYVHWKLCE